MNKLTPNKMCVLARKCCTCPCTLELFCCSVQQNIDAGITANLVQRIYLATTNILFKIYKTIQDLKKKKCVSTQGVLKFGFGRDMLPFLLLRNVQLTFSISSSPSLADWKKSETIPLVQLISWRISDLGHPPPKKKNPIKQKHMILFKNTLFSSIS